MPADERPVFVGQFGDSHGHVLRAYPFLVDAIHQAPVACLLAGTRVGWFARRKIIAGKVDHLFRPVFFPVAQQGEAKILVHEPPNLKVFLRGAESCSTVNESVIEVVIVAKS